MTLWKKTTAKYKDINENEGYTERAECGCENKWKLVHLLCSKWISAVATLSALNKSCYDEVKTLEDTYKAYKVKNKGKRFTHSTAVDVLEQYPKWMSWTQLDLGGPRKLNVVDREWGGRGVAFGQKPCLVTRQPYKRRRRLQTLWPN